VSLATGLSPLDLLDPRFDLAAELEDALLERWTLRDLLTLLVETTHAHYRAYLSAHGVKEGKLPTLDLRSPKTSVERSAKPTPVSLGELATLAGRSVEQKAARRGR
jgi:hypothetical protein